jgi:DNA-binding NarL/FixJ family response regulator
MLVRSPVMRRRILLTIVAGVVPAGCAGSYPPTDPSAQELMARGEGPLKGWKIRPRPAPDFAALDRPDGPDPPVGRGAPANLSRRELELLRLVGSGQTNELIAKQLFLSEKTVDRHVSNIFVKTNVSSRAGATAFAYQHGLV